MQMHGILHYMFSYSLQLDMAGKYSVFVVFKPVGVAAHKAA